MRPVRLLAVYLGIVFVGGALLAPFLYWAAQSVIGWGPVFGHLAANPFHRFVDRALLGAALLGLAPLLWQCDMLSWEALGFRGNGRASRQIFTGFLTGWASLALVALAACGAGVRSINATHLGQEWLHRLLTAVLTAIVVAVIEEILFRGALYGILRKSLSWVAALVISSALYALVHFIQKADLGATVRWDSGLIVLGKMFDAGGALVPAFFTLFAAGAILALARERTGGLYFSIGLHAGWIFWLKSYRFVTREHGAGGLFWGTDNLIDGWFALAVLVFFFMALCRLLPRNAESI